MNYNLYGIGLLILSAILISGVSGAVASTAPVTLSAGSAGITDLTLDTAPSGISGYQVTVSSDNPAVVKITGATFPAWAALSEAVPADGGAYALRAIDLNSGVEAGASGITLATLSLQATGAGNAKVTIQGLQVDDDAGNALQAEGQGGSITVTGGAGPAPAPTTEPVTQDMPVALKAGWNLINIPMQPSSGFETAGVFKSVQSAGHSILTYDGSSGWVTIGKNDLLRPMTGYWIYSTTSVSIPLTASGIPTESKALTTGWNLAGVSGTTAQTAELALSGLSSWTYVVTYDNSSQQYRDAGVKGAQAQTMLAPGEGFWIYVNSPESLSPAA